MKLTIAHVFSLLQNGKYRSNAIWSSVSSLCFTCEVICYSTVLSKISRHPSFLLAVTFLSFLNSPEK